MTHFHELLELVVGVGGLLVLLSTRQKFEHDATSASLTYASFLWYALIRSGVAAAALYLGGRKKKQNTKKWRLAAATADHRQGLRATLLLPLLL
jgi:hypothetical protein